MLDLLKNSIISFPNLFFSLPFTLGGITKFSKNDIKAYWQPPGYIFGIVWSTLYLIFGFINLKTIYSTTLSQYTKNLIIGQSIIEALLQTLWLITTGNYGSGRNITQYICGLIVMIGLLRYTFVVRIPTFKRYDYNSFLLYLPYTLWISFAAILNLQLILKSIS